MKTFTITSISVLFAFIIGIIISLLLFLNTSRKKLNKLSETINDLNNSEIIYIVKIKDTIPIFAEISVEDNLLTNASLLLQEDFHFNSQIPINQELDIPIDVNINKIISLDTIINIDKDVIVYMQDTFPINQQVRMKIIGNKTIPFFINADIPIEKEMCTSIKNSVPVKGDFPVNFDFSQEIPIKLEMDIPVDMVIPLNMPLNTNVSVSLNEKIPITGQIPITMEIPVKIKIKDTDLNKNIEKISNQIKNLLYF